MDLKGAFECTKLVEAVFHLKIGCIGPQENYTVDNLWPRYTPFKSNFQLFQSCFSNKNFYFHSRLSKIYSFNPSLKNTLGLYVFGNFGQETKILFEKSEINFEKSVGTQIYMAN